MLRMLFSFRCRARPDLNNLPFMRMHTDIVYIPTIRPRKNQPSNKPYQQTKAECRNNELAKLASLC
jgi:hypothetical protein